MTFNPTRINRKWRALTRQPIRQWLFVIPILLIGCGRGDQPDLGTVTGVVTLNGAPLSHVEVTFVPEAGRPSYGETDNDGKYELTYIRDTKGAKVGKHTISVRSTKVDNAAFKPVEIQPGPNVVNIECTPNSRKSTEAQGDDA